jgi:hypothetical protein
LVVVVVALSGMVNICDTALSSHHVFVVFEETNSLSSSRLWLLLSTIVKGRDGDNSSCFLALIDDDETVAVAVVILMLRKLRVLKSHPLPRVNILLPSVVVEENIEDEDDEDDDVVEYDSEDDVDNEFLALFCCCCLGCNSCS